MPTNINVLLVDDNPMIREMLRQALAHFSTVETMSDAGDALLKAIHEKPDLIITDFAMNGMDGRQLLQKITQSTQGLLLGGLRLLDESGRDTEENVIEA